jgi:quercetin dioxygenase-like cupin family protein
MLRGKSNASFDDPGFEYLPGETVVIPSNVEMKIDFRKRLKVIPPQCLALAIEQINNNFTIFK